MRVWLALLFACVTTAAHADGLRARDILGITTGMTVEEVDAQIKAVNHAMGIKHLPAITQDGAPSYTIIVQGTLGGGPGASPQDQISVRFTKNADGSVRSIAVARLVNPVPDNERIPIKDFIASLVQKYGPASTNNPMEANEARWVFKGKGTQVVDSLDDDRKDYNRCSGVISTIEDMNSSAGLPDNANPDCADFLYVLPTALDTEHADVLGGFYMLYLQQAQFAKAIATETEYQDNEPPKKQVVPEGRTAPKL